MTSILQRNHKASNLLVDVVELERRRLLLPRLLMAHHQQRHVRCILRCRRSARRMPRIPASCWTRIRRLSASPIQAPTAPSTTRACSSHTSELLRRPRRYFGHAVCDFQSKRTAATHQGHHSRCYACVGVHYHVADHVLQRIHLHQHHSRRRLGQVLVRLDGCKVAVRKRRREGCSERICWRCWTYRMLRVDARRDTLIPCDQTRASIQFGISCYTPLSTSSEHVNCIAFFLHAVPMLTTKVTIYLYKPPHYTSHSPRKQTPLSSTFPSNSASPTPPTQHPTPHLIPPSPPKPPVGAKHAHQEYSREMRGA